MKAATVKATGRAVRELERGDQKDYLGPPSTTPHSFTLQVGQRRGKGKRG